jgi:hypothetical protein
LPQLGDDFLGFMLSPGHFQSSFGYKSHTSGRITFQGEGHRLRQRIMLIWRHKLVSLSRTASGHFQRSKATQTK